MDLRPTSPMPYRKQETRWTCGAASLRMVYGSFGQEFSEAELWAILKPDQLDRTGVNPSRLAWAAQARGFPALAVQARRPWEMLSACALLGIRVVFHVPLSRGSPRRHFAVLARADEAEVVLNDPQFGPSLAFGKADWLEFWGEVYGNYQAAPNELVAVADPASAPAHAACPECEGEVPESWPCPACREPILLRPAAALGCAGDGCPARLWERIACPSCDHPLTRLDESGSDADGAFDLEKLAMSSGGPFRDLSAAMNNYQKTFAKMQGVASDASLRDVLGKLQESMKLATDKLGDAMDRFEAQNEDRRKQVAERRAEAGKGLEEAKKAREEALAALAAKKAAKAARPRPGQAAEDPDLGAKLRDKLLEEFGTRVDRPPPGPLDAQGSLIDFDPRA